MSNLKTYFNDVVRIVKNTPAYAKAVPVLAKALYQRFTGQGVFEVTFIKVGKKWYCDVPGFPKELFEHTLMVAGAAKFIDYYSRGEDKVVAEFMICNEKQAKYFCGALHSKKCTAERCTFCYHLVARAYMASARILALSSRRLTSMNSSGLCSRTSSPGKMGPKATTLGSILA